MTQLCPSCKRNKAAIKSSYDSVVRGIAQTAINAPDDVAADRAIEDHIIDWLDAHGLEGPCS